MSGETTVAEFFDRRASLYDDHYDDDTADGHALRARLDAVLRLVGDGPGDALDAGMGPGRLVSELAARRWTVSGIDVSEEMVAAARARLPERSEHLVQAGIERLPWPDASFDVVTATGVLEYARVGEALRELARVVRPGGTVVVSYPNPRAVYSMWKSHLWYPVVRLAKRALGRPVPRLPRGGAGAAPPERFTALLRTVGLTPHTVVPTSFLPVVTPLDMLAPRTTARLGRRLEGRTGIVARRTATQVVYAATVGPEPVDVTPAANGA